MQLCARDIGNMYLEAYTKEKVCLFSGPKFGSKGMSGLRSSGARYHEILLMFGSVIMSHIMSTALCGLVLYCMLVTILMNSSRN